MDGVSVNSALIPFKYNNNKEDDKEEPQMKHRKDGEMGKVQVGRTKG